MHRDMFHFGYSVQMTADDTAEIMLYGEIIADMPDEWKWSEEDKSAADFKRAIDDVRKRGANNLLLRINSPGGVCTESVAMRSILGNAGFDKITIRIEGLCASAATDIATLPGAHVEIAEGSEYMIHNPWCVAVGNADDLSRTIDRLRNIETMSRGFYVARTGQSEEQIKEWMDAETWFTAEEAVENGFCDTLLKSDTAMPIAACVSTEEMAAMKGLYKAVPEQIAVIEEVSNGTPEAGEPTEINEQEVCPMELDKLTVEQLQEENPALIDQIRQEAVASERERLADIDALTIPGYEDLAVQAKANGTSVLEFQKQIVAAMKQKGTEFLQSRQAETAPAQDVAGDAPAQGKTEEDEVNELAASIASYATQCGNYNDGMF